MKVGDKFKSNRTGCEWRLVLDHELQHVRMQALPEGDLYGTGAPVADTDNITKEEFSEISQEKRDTLFVELDGTPLFPEETYQLGDRFVIVNEDNPFNGDVYILCSADGRSISLISVESGSRWTEPVPVGELLRISKAEVKAAMGTHPDDFKKVTK